MVSPASAYESKLVKSLKAFPANGESLVMLSSNWVELNMGSFQSMLPSPAMLESRESMAPVANECDVLKRTAAGAVAAVAQQAMARGEGGRVFEFDAMSHGGRICGERRGEQSARQAGGKLESSAGHSQQEDIPWMTAEGVLGV